VTIATTHYGALKDFATRTDHVENGSMEFDVNTLAPTYRFRQGIPGGSYAVEIGRRLGLPQMVLDRTTEIIGRDERRLDELIITLDRERQMHEETREEIENRRDELDRLTAEYREKLDTYRKTERDLLRNAREEADRVIRDANAVIEHTIADLRKEQASRASIKQAKDRITAQRAQLRKLAEDGPVSKPIESIAPGDEVWVESLQKKAVVVQAPDSGDRLRVRAGRIELTVRRSDLRAPAESEKTAEEKQKPSEPRNVRVHTETRITPELDVRGYTAADAIDAVDKYIDQASIDGLARVRILHGKGSGILRQEISEFLKYHELVKSTRFAAQNEGGTGVTVVEMD
jgi:DNA mismatch repair protein MutS2